MLADCKILEMPKFNDPRGNLTFIESGNQIPFNINRVYYLYDVPNGSVRGGHAHKALHQLIIPISGSFDIHLDDGYSKTTMQMNQRNCGLYICPMIWREIDNFSTNAVCMVLASHFYSEDDYYRDYKGFLAAMISKVKHSEHNDVLVDVMIGVE